MKNIKNNKALKIVVPVIIVFVIVVISIIIIIFNYSGFNFKSKLSQLNNNKIELKTTDTVTNTKEGVYITDVSDVVENTMPSIVAITSKTLIQSGYYGPFASNNQTYSTGAGSGIIISQSDSELLILTNNHVVEDATELSVQFIDGESVDATVKGTYEKKDVAVISVKLSDIKSSTLENIKVATIGDSSTLKVGNGIIAIGNALGYGQSVTTGVISALDRKVSNSSDNTYIQIDAAINGGNSGGALLNSVGEVVGINCGKYSSSAYSSSTSIEGMGFAIPISDVKDIITELMNGETPTSDDIELGIKGYMTNSTNMQGYNFPTGFYVAEISDDSYAAKSDLEIGNIITEIDGNQVQQLSDITKVLESKKVGDKVELKIKYISNRDYKEKVISISFS